MRHASKLFALLLLATAAPAAAQHDSHAPMPPQTLAEWSQGARLYDGLGTFHRAVTTRVPEAQRYFDQGMRFVWAFNHDEATRSFAKAAGLDPACASRWGGVALAPRPKYNMPMMAEARAKAGWEALARARAAAPAASPVEQALIEALSKRFLGDK